ncbi:hypothetical protein BDZ94DRAFT_1313478 [Collybia nuda]|uniref:Uncharacterized protein n=1 Tax=Collybia nuda TaxID=64659 RepID=A0A9P5XV91_9AGAR|nr:hypothetical protein BDZ94DRAFT_1313478 [Collybia nuda]
MPQASGTQSPPLEATGEDKPMGASSVNSTGPVEAVKDGEQRKQYFQSPEGSGETPSTKGGKANPKKMGQSMADTFEKLD